jgi:hypothetical protein
MWRYRLGIAGDIFSHARLAIWNDRGEAEPEARGRGMKFIAVPVAGCGGRRRPAYDAFHHGLRSKVLNPNQVKNLTTSRLSVPGQNRHRIGEFAQLWPRMV